MSLRFDAKYERSKKKVFFVGATMSHALLNGELHEYLLCP